MHFAVAIAGVLLARLPVAGVLSRAAAVLPFSGLFASVRAFMGEPEQAVALVIKSYTSAVIVILLVGTLGLPRFLYALSRLGLPKPLVLTIQFLYRYLLVLGAEAQAMLRAAQCRLGGAHRDATFSAASGSVSVLFARAYGRAERIHGAMLSRGFDGQMRELRREHFVAADLIVPIAAVLVLTTHLATTNPPWR